MALSKEEYYRLFNQIKELINEEFDFYNKSESRQYKEEAYPLFLVMYSFLRLLRGEAFTNVRPHTPEYQKEFYETENDFWNKIKEFRKDIDFSVNEKGDYKLKEWRNIFENPKEKREFSFWQKIIKKMFRI